MRDIFDQDKSLSLGAIRQAAGIFNLLLAALVLLSVLRGLGRLFTGHFIGAFVETLGAFAVLGFLFLVVRLLTELLASMHRLNDRLTVLGDDLRSVRSADED
ncbi:hypothetical protein HAD_03820 [Hyphomonas adhaerens MHS-3]|uniref:DUF4282 domain-containing protein n=1 Tax=Hyphomonas adhaerens MHS-3 TaxID=1280949 RepID=A0A069E459_9PROT|nr:hypothetical protein [Hyphomonas adhaerens]KCZ84777.1 hypothetical protein HAD_03820 [Hyphomonas adhaerens MHS-3]|tara:strand:+ start:14367 stop:14672 length:306 start_codon:yes stop_codon:yes gene_type:complete